MKLNLKLLIFNKVVYQNIHKNIINYIFMDYYYLKIIFMSFHLYVFYLFKKSIKIFYQNKMEIFIIILNFQYLN